MAARERIQVDLRLYGKGPRNPEAKNLRVRKEGNGSVEGEVKTGSSSAWGNYLMIESCGWDTELTLVSSPFALASSRVVSSYRCHSRPTNSPRRASPAFQHIRSRPQFVRYSRLPRVQRRGKWCAPSARRICTATVIEIRHVSQESDRK